MQEADKLLQCHPMSPPSTCHDLLDVSYEHNKADLRIPQGIRSDRLCIWLALALYPAWLHARVVTGNG